MGERIYFAGPLFTPHVRQWLEETGRRLRAEGHVVFVPHENPGPRPPTADSIFHKDMEGLGPATVVVAVLDGVQVDDGTACEIGIFWGMKQGDARKKKIFGIVSDNRRIRKRDAGLPSDVNLFVEGCILDSGGKICYSVDELVEALSNA